MNYFVKLLIKICCYFPKLELHFYTSRGKIHIPTCFHKISLGTEGLTRKYQMGKPILT